MFMNKNDAVSADIHSTTELGLNNAVWKATSVDIYWDADDATEDALQSAASRPVENAVDSARRADPEHPGLRIYLRNVQ
jgi:hypothetical protein